MARRKRNSSVLERAERRIESLQSLNVELDFGQGVTVEAYTANINDLRSKLATYNTALSSIDKLTDDVRNAEQVVLAMSEKMLMGVGSRYGKTSQEYEMAGGVRRRKNSRRATGNSRRSAQAASVNGALLKRAEREGE
ncbi:MAG: hypothetical protein KME40_29190 [Komarekiella atlantica HA4396-MV6]|jgi:hypothetical protein|nr:hypothetical protein [Komarekiella atlantica HA4396-MV6]